MKKLLLCAVLFVSLLSPVKQTNAAIGGVVALAGGGATIALTGLTLSAGSVIGLALSYDLEAAEGVGAFLGFIMIPLGIIILDGDIQMESNFPEYDSDELTEIGLTKPQSQAYQENREELSSAFNSAMNAGTVEESTKVWDEVKMIYGEDAVEGLVMVLNSLGE